MIPTNRSPTHPGEVLLEEFLKPLELSQVEAARRMGIPLNRLNEIIHGRRNVSAETAVLLSRLLNTSPEFWLHLQTAWDLHRAFAVLRLPVRVEAGARFPLARTAEQRQGRSAQTASIGRRRAAAGRQPLKGRKSRRS